MDASTNDLTDTRRMDHDGTPPAAAPDAPVEDVEAAEPSLLDELAFELSPAEILVVTQRHVERLGPLDPAGVVGPAAEIAEVLGRLIDEDDH